MAGSFLKYQFLTTTLFTKRPLLVFFLYWIAWTAIYIIFYYFTTYDGVPWKIVFHNCVVLGSINFLLFYLVAFYLVPFIAFKKRQWLLLVLLCLLSAVFFTYIKAEANEAYMERRQKEYAARGGYQFPRSPGYNPSAQIWRWVKYNMLFSLAIVMIAVGYRFLLTWYIQEKIKKELENQKLKAELSFLKMQVNPHFLFNSLNNIYSLAVMEKSTRTGNSIMKLSDLVRYMLYEKEDEDNKVSLDTEIRHINSFIDLQKLRHTESIYIQFSIEGDTQGKKVPPLLLFPLIENSCKHGIVKDPEKPVNIEIKVTDSHFYFRINNFINNYLKDETGGIGLQNVKKRLALLYPNNHTLNINETKEIFLVELRLPL